MGFVKEIQKKDDVQRPDFNLPRQLASCLPCYVGGQNDYHPNLPKTTFPVVNINLGRSSSRASKEAEMLIGRNYCVVIATISCYANSPFEL